MTQEDQDAIQPNLHILSVLVENKFGVLARIAGLFSRRGFNIFSLAVAPTDDPSLSRISIVVDVHNTDATQIAKPRGRYEAPDPCRQVIDLLARCVAREAALHKIF